MASHTTRSCSVFSHTSLSIKSIRVISPARILCVQVRARSGVLTYSPIQPSTSAAAGHRPTSPAKSRRRTGALKKPITTVCLGHFKKCVFDKDGGLDCSPEVKPESINRHLVVNCSIGHESCLLHVNGRDADQRKKHKVK